MKEVIKVIEFEYDGHKHSKSVLKTKGGDSRYEKMSDEDIIAKQIKILMRVDAFRKKCCK
tara:strand:+ start:126 stop:305 length:180 start_codon:yes stop_codon:yes gene_type:complete